jgi:uncharacterized protein (TIGR02217 family)
MAFIESPRFPENIAYNAVGGPEFSTAVAAATSGRESRNSNWLYPLHSWDVSQGINSQADFQTLRAFFMAVGRGRANGWRFKDYADHTASHAGVEAGVVDGITSTTFQLVKRYTIGGSTQDRRILKPIAAGFELKDSGTTLALTADYSLNTATGVVTTTAPRTAGNLTWSGEFDVPMRFNTDKLEGRIVARNPRDGLLHEWAEIPIVELLQP